MTRLRLFGRCRIYHDPVTPVLRAPAQIGWEAWFRTIDLVTPQPKGGAELLREDQGLVDSGPEDVADIVRQYGRIVVGDQGELMVECEDEATMEALGNTSRKVRRSGPDRALKGSYNPSRSGTARATCRPRGGICCRAGFGEERPVWPS